MDKGIKTLQKHVSKIDKSNNSIIDKALKHAFKLKNTKLSDISYNNISVSEILIHKDTNNFPILKQKILSKISELHIQYPFINLYFDPYQDVQPGSKSLNRKLTSQNDNRLLLVINWQDYMRYSLKNEQQLPINNLPEKMVKEMLDTTKRKNLVTLQESIRKILATASSNTTKEYTETPISLENNTMRYEITRNHYNLIAQQIMKNYNGIIELFINNNSVVTIRVHWNIYLSQLASLERQQSQIPLLPTEFNPNFINSLSHSPNIQPPNISLNQSKTSDPYQYIDNIHQQKKKKNTINDSQLRHKRYIRQRIKRRKNRLLKSDDSITDISDVDDTTSVYSQSSDEEYLYKQSSNPIQQSIPSSPPPQYPHQYFQPPVQSFQPPVQSFQPPVQSFQPPIQSFQQPIQSFQPPIQSFQPPIQSFQPPIQSFQPPKPVTMYPITQPTVSYPSLESKSNQMENNNLPPPFIPSQQNLLSSITYPPLNTSNNNSSINISSSVPAINDLSSIDSSIFPSVSNLSSPVQDRSVFSNYPSVPNENDLWIPQEKLEKQEKQRQERQEKQDILILSSSSTI